MMGFSLTVLGLAVLIALLHLGLGWGLGRSFPKGSAPVLDAQTLRQLAEQMQSVVDSIRRDVGDHQGRIRAASNQLLARNPASATSDLTDFVLATVAQIVETNERLQNRLSAAEVALHAQEETLQEYLSDARTDPLTGLANRRALDLELDRHVAHYHRQKRPFCIAILDIDFFKNVNDGHGHVVGDRALHSLAQVLRQPLREGDFLARYGGEEFALVLPDTTAPEAADIAERLRHAVDEAPYDLDGLKMHLTVSVGVAEMTDPDTATSLVERADAALYASKQAGRNRVHYMPPGGEPCCVGPANQARPRADVAGETAPAMPPPRAVGDAGMDEVELEQICRDLNGEIARLTGRQ